MRALRATLAIALASCGGDDTPANPPPRPAGAGAPGAAVVGPNGQKVVPLPDRTKIEDVVRCEIPDKPTDPKDGKCDPKAPDCPEHTYCLTLASGSFCEPCPERDGIRHAFKERDFAVEQNRDPFQSFLLPQLSPTIGKGEPVIPIDPTKKCVREDQMVASAFGYNELKLVGIVAQGTQRKVLMMGGGMGYIIKRGDCVGKEKAVVKDIGTGYITFLVDDPASPQKSTEISVQLHPTQVAVSSQPVIDAPLAPKTTIAPIVAPPPTVPAKPGAAGSNAPAAGSNAAPPPGVPIQAPPKI